MKQDQLRIAMSDAVRLRQATLPMPGTSLN